jgi:HEAT repeat protein
MRFFGPPDITKLESERNIKGLTKGLKDKDCEIRLKAVSALGRIGDEIGAVDGLAIAIDDEYWNVVCEALTALGKIGTEKAVDELIIALKSKNSSVRKMSAELLGGLQNERAIEGLTLALKDEISFVKEAALESISCFSSALAVPPLSSALKDKSPKIRQMAVSALSRMNEDLAVDGLVIALKDRVPKIRKLAIESLINFRCDKCIEGLILAMRDKDCVNRYLAVSELGRFENQNAIEGLALALKDEDVNFRRKAIASLGEIGGERVVESLISALKDENKILRGEAVQLLGNIHSKRAVEVLIGSLKDEESEVRCAIAKVLGNIGGEPAVEGLTSALKDQNCVVRLISAQSLGKIGGEQSIKGLISALTDEDEDVREVAVESLSRIGGKQVIELLVCALNNQEPRVGLMTLSVLEKIGGEDSVDGLTAALKNEDSVVRREAVRSLGRIGTDHAIEGLIISLDDKVSAVRLVTVESLDRIGNKRAVDGLIISLGDCDGRVKLAAVKSLARIGTEYTVESLIIALKDLNSEIREISAVSLGKIGDRRAVEDLIIALRDPEQSVREAAFESLDTIGGERAKEARNIALSDEHSGIQIFSYLENFGEIRKAVFNLLFGFDSTDQYPHGLAFGHLDYKYQGINNALNENYKKIPHQLKDSLWLKLEEIALKKITAETLEKNDNIIPPGAFGFHPFKYRLVDKSVDFILDNFELITEEVRDALWNELITKHAEIIWLDCLRDEARQRSFDLRKSNKIPKQLKVVVKRILSKRKDEGFKTALIFYKNFNKLSEEIKKELILYLTTQDKSDPFVIYVILESVERMRSKADVEVLLSVVVNALQDSDESVRNFASSVLGHIRSANDIRRVELPVSFARPLGEIYKIARGLIKESRQMIQVENDNIPEQFKRAILRKMVDVEPNFMPDALSEILSESIEETSFVPENLADDTFGESTDDGDMNVFFEKLDKLPGKVIKELFSSLVNDYKSESIVREAIIETIYAIIDSTECAEVKKQFDDLIMLEPEVSEEEHPESVIQEPTDAEKALHFKTEVVKAMTETLAEKGLLSLSVIFEGSVNEEIRNIITDSIKEVTAKGNGERLVSFQSISDYGQIHEFESELQSFKVAREGYQSVEAQNFLASSLSKEAYAKGLWIFVTSSDISTKDSRLEKELNIGGLTIPLVCMLISTKIYHTLLSSHIEKYHAACYLRSVVFHEMGHLFSVPSPKRIVSNNNVMEKWGYHCTNSCVMEQSENIFSIISQSASKGTSFSKKPFCKQCEQDLKQAIKEISASRKIDKIIERRSMWKSWLK